MKIIKSLFIHRLILALVLLSFNAYAADQSMCDPDSNVVLFSNGFIQSCQLRDNFDVHDITCKNNGFILSY